MFQTYWKLHGIILQTNTCRLPIFYQSNPVFFCFKFFKIEKTLRVTDLFEPLAFDTLNNCVQYLSTLLLAAAAAKSLQSCPTWCDPIDGSPPGSPIPGILQARIMKWGAIAFSNYTLVAET